jgi:hypothetical protein
MMEGLREGVEGYLELRELGPVDYVMPRHVRIAASNTVLSPSLAGSRKVLRLWLDRGGARLHGRCPTPRAVNSQGLTFGIRAVTRPSRAEPPSCQLTIIEPDVDTQEAAAQRSTCINM